MDGGYIDLNLHEGEISDNIIDSPLHLFIQEVELAIQTGPNEIWGIKDSINLNRYLFNKYVTITQIRNEILTFIGKHCQHASMFQYNLSVQTIKTETNKDLIYIEFKVDMGENSDDFIQKFLLGQ